MSQEEQYKNHGRSGEFDCIWMTSNIIDYQACEKNFDCESCTLDKILKNLGSVENLKSRGNIILNGTDFLDKIIGKLEATNLDPKLIYLKNDLVLKHLFANIYYLGINPVILNLLDNIGSVKDCMKKVYFNAGQTIVVLNGSWGELPVKAPMSFLLLDKLNWTPEDIVNRQWLALIVINQSEIIDSQISGEEWKVEKFKALNAMHEYKECCLKINPSLLATSEKINYIYQLTGKAEYIKLLNAVAND
ncbi:MAG: hypothetical protein P4L45_15705 [Ignavibacteriaceae bacterium]|nr:hypothetical protein [Ignavibacteriaceae bacterium]